MIGMLVKEHLLAEQSEDDRRLRDIKAKLGTLLLNLATRSHDSDHREMYLYCEQLSGELLQMDVRD